MKTKENSRNFFRWRSWYFAVLFFLNLILVAGGDCLLHFPVPGSIYTSPPEVLDQRLAEEPILHDEITENFRLFAVNEEGETRLLVLEQFGPISRCRVLKDDVPPSLPWLYYLQGRAFDVTCNLTPDGAIEIQDTRDHSRMITARYILLTCLLEVTEVLVVKGLRKARKSKKS